MHNSDKEGLSQRASALLGLGSISCGWTVQINSSGGVLVEGCTGVISCDDNHIRLGFRGQSLLVSGCDLYINNMYGQTVCICGRVTCVEII